MKKIFEKKWASYTIAVCSAVLLYMILAHISPILGWLSSLWKMLTPVLVGFILAYLINPIMHFLEARPLKKIRKDKVRHMLSVIISVIFVLLILTAMVMMVVPALIDSIKGVAATLNKYGYSNITALLNEINKFNIGFQIDTTQLDQYVDSGLDKLFAALKDNLSLILNEVNNIGASVFNFVIGFIIAVYLLIGKKSVDSAIHQLGRASMTPSEYRKNAEFWNRCHKIFIQYIGCSLLDGCIIGSVNAVFMMITGMENIALISVIVGIANLLPTFGPIIGGLLGALFLVLTNPVDALVFIIFTVVLQIIDGYVIKPKLFSTSLGLSPVLSLISIILGGKMFGFVGILLAIPVTAVLVMLYYEELIPWFENRRDKRIEEENIPEQTVSDKNSDNS